MKQIYPKYLHLIGFFYVNNDYFRDRKRVLGITWDELPSMAFNMIDNRVIPYPRGARFSKEGLVEWFDDIIAGKVQAKTSGFSRVVKDFEIYPMLLNNTLQVNRENYQEMVLQEGFDTVLFLYTTEEILNP